MPKVILLSQIPLPYSQIGSWTTLYKNYLESDHLIDAIVCPVPENYFENVSYGIVNETVFQKIQKRYFKKNYDAYFLALKKLVKKDEKYILQIVDNFGIIPHLEQFLKENQLRGQFYIQFFYHGYAPFFGNFQSRSFYEFVDEMILLTEKSYQEHKNLYTVLPCRFSVLHNGIDTSKFYKVSEEQKIILKNKLELGDKKVFVWCSQDRPKKGLDLILDVWKRIYPKNGNSVLLVIGAKRTQLIDGVQFLGKIPNDELPAYLQVSDAYLFPSLWHEGFGLSLIEALHCGCYCIASALGGIPEVLQFGQYGKLIENPHFIKDWTVAIEDYLKNDPKVSTIPETLYSKENWNQGMNAIINEAKISLGL